MDSAARDRIARNLNEVRKRIASAAQRAGRDPGEITLVAVVKSVGVEEARILADLGVRDLAENRVEVAGEKVRALPDSIVWHMVGSVQRRKVRDVVELFDCVDSVDRMSLAESLQRRCAEAGTKMPILVQVNVSGESEKHGFGPEAAAGAVSEIQQMPNLQVRGLMTMAPVTDDAETARPVFAGLRALGRETGVEALSMGMSNDFEVAIEEGATEVRIGRTLFN